MTLRISTAGLYAQSLQGLLQRQAEMARTQQELVTGNKLFRAADNPAGMAESQRLDHTLATLDQHGRNAGLLEHRMRSQEQAMADIGSQLTRVRELTVQANSAALSDSDRRSIAIEVRSIRNEILSIANRDDGAGRRLFAGTRDGVVPFADNGGSVSYAGDDSRNRVEIAPDLSLDDTDAGSDIFLRVRTGDGISRGVAGAGNSGSGVIQSSSVTDHVAWAGKSLRVDLTSATTYEVRDAANTLLASGTYAPNTAISAGGVQLTLTGAPAAGDTFAVERAPTRDIFATLKNLADALDAPATTAADVARRSNALGAALSDIATAEDHMLTVRSSTGTRLAAMDSAANSRSAGEVSLLESLSVLRDVDYTKAISRLSVQMTAMDAAQKTMLRMQSMSLFDRL